MVLPNISENLQKRIISAGVLAPLVLAIIWLGGGWFSTLVAFVAVIMSFEWYGIISAKQDDKENALTKDEYQKWINYGIVYVGVFAASLLYLRDIDNGFWAVLLLLLIVWATDIAAYFTGSIIKGPKIYPAISPNKTWSGLIGGMVAAGFVGAFSSVFVHSLGVVAMVILSASLAVVAQSGDFLESWIKRKFGVKDSGNIIPGHGGLMDRLDGFTTVAPVFAFIAILNGGSFV